MNRPTQKVSTSRALSLASSAKTSIRSLHQIAYKNGYTQTQINNHVQDILIRLPPYPRWLRTEVRTYSEGYSDLMVEGHVRFLYSHNDTYYSVSGSKDTGFPSYGTLPSGVRAKTGWSKCGGLFWIYPGRQPKVYYTYTHLQGNTNQ